VLRRALPLMLVAGLGLAAPDRATSQQQDQAPASPGTVVSSDRVSEGLRRPELQLPPVTTQEPIFRSGVTERLETPLDVIRRELREEARLHLWNAHYAPGVIAQVDVLPVVMSLVTKIKTIRREHAEAEARQMVQQELAEFCAQHDCSQAADALPLEGIILPK